MGCISISTTCGSLPTASLACVLDLCASVEFHLKFLLAATLAVCSYPWASLCVFSRARRQFAPIPDTVQLAR